MYLREKFIKDHVEDLDFNIIPKFVDALQNQNFMQRNVIL